MVFRITSAVAFFASMTLTIGFARAGPAADFLPPASFDDPGETISPVDNSAFRPGNDAEKAQGFAVRLIIEQTAMHTEPEITQPICDGAAVEQGGSCRGGDDKRLFPAISLEAFTVGDILSFAETGQMVKETGERPGGVSYWRVIPQDGRVWTEPGETRVRAAFPLMLVHDFENHAHQGLASFLIDTDGNVSDLWIQFVQQTTPWNIPQHFTAAAVAQMTAEPSGIGNLDDARLSTIERRNARLPHQPWAMLPEADMLEGFGGPLADNWVVMRALVKDGVIWHQPSETAFGPYPYPEEMRFGPRSVTKSVTAPLALGRLSQKYGPFILNLKIGDLLDGLDPEYAEVRLLDAANMATGMGGAGSLRTAENDDGDGYVDATYDDWYNGAPSHKEKLDAITRDASPYPWGPGVVMRYRDRDYHLLGAALDAFVKQVEGPNADIWGLLEEEVFNPIGIATAPIVRTIEPDGSDGLPWFHAGYYPTMDDMAKIAQLYHNRGLFEGEQLLHPEVIEQLFSTNGAIPKSTDLSWQTAFTGQAPQPAADGEELYKMGMHLVPHRDAETGELVYLPAMFGFSSNQIILYPGELTSMRFAKAWPMPGPEWETTGHEDTIAAVNRLGSFSK